jgi:hypothetical protein
LKPTDSNYRWVRYMLNGGHFRISNAVLHGEQSSFHFTFNTQFSTLAYIVWNTSTWICP